MARPQPRAFLLCGQPRDHTRGPLALVQARIRAVSHVPLRGTRTPDPDAMDDRALPRTIAALMRRLRRSLQTLRARPGVAAVVTLGVAWGLIMHQLGWAQTAHFAQVRALSHGEAQIDRWHWETNDKAWVDGHFYSVKSPGMAALTTPVYMAIDALGGQ